MAEPDLARINNTLGKMGYHLANHNSICVSVSGGSDSDIIIEKTDEAYQEYLQQEADSLEAWMLEKEKAEGGDQGEENQEYQAAVVYQEHCERYEPTYNPEDGSM